MLQYFQRITPMYLYIYRGHRNKVKNTFENFKMICRTTKFSQGVNRSFRATNLSPFFLIHARNSVNLVVRSTIPMKLTQYAVCGSRRTHTYTHATNVERCANKTAIYSSEKTYVVTRKTQRQIF